MATVNEKMTALADAVRGKTGDTDKLTLDEMTSAITNYTTDATATAAKIFIDETAYVNGNKIIGTFTIDDEIATQESLINQINTALEGKSAGSGGTTATAPDTCTFTLSHVANDTNLRFYYTAWENNTVVSKILTVSGTANNVLCNSLIIADTSTGAITKSAVFSNATMLYASNDSTMIVFRVTASAGGNGQIYMMTGQSGM